MTQANSKTDNISALDKIITSVSTGFIHLGPEEVDAGIQHALQLIGEHAGVDRSYVFLFSDNGMRMTNTHEWCARGIASQKDRIQDQPVERLPTLTAKIKNLEVVHIPDVAALPDTVRGDRAEAEAQGILSLILVPLVFQSRAIGFLGFDSVRGVKTWSDDSIALLKIIGEIFVNAFERKRTHVALHESQQMLEQRVAERTRELSTLLELSHKLSSTLELAPQLDLILDQLNTVVDFHGASILELKDQVLKVVAYRGPISQETAMKLQFRLDEAGANQAVIEGRKPVIISDVLGSSPLARDFQLTAGTGLETTFNYVRSWMGVPLIARGQIIGMLSLDHPTPDYYHHVPHSQLALAFANQVAAAIDNARLYRETRKSADEAQTLFAVQQAITTRLDPDAVLQMIADQARRLTNTEQGAVYLLDGDELVVSVISGNVSPEMLGYRLPVDGSVAGLALRSGRPYLISAAEEDERVHTDIVERVGAHSFIIVPLVNGGRPNGTITVANKQSGVLGPEDERVLTMLASGAVIALENARLYQEEQERRREADRRRQVAEVLRDILAILNSNRPLDDILDYIVNQAAHLTGSDVGVIYRYDPRVQGLFIEAGCCLPEELQVIQSKPECHQEVVRAMLERRPYVLPEVQSSNRVDLEAASWSERLGQHYRAFLGVPVVIRDELYGSLGLFHLLPQEFSEEDVGLAVTFADQVALAVQNARLRSQVEKSAIAAERSRLARELHDAVTQTLFSASLIAEVLPRLWERNPVEARRRLDELRQLTRGALAEMRTLLLELRPAALVEAELSELFRHLVEAFTGRARIPVKFSMEGNYNLPPEVKVAFYRIAQEALNNIAKHAGASQAVLEIICQPNQVSLTVEDDGHGFDLSSIPPEHLGLGIMKERAENIQADLRIRSKIGQGTRVTVVWSVTGGEL